MPGREQSVMTASPTLPGTAATHRPGELGVWPTRAWVALYQAPSSTRYRRAAQSTLRRKSVYVEEEGSPGRNLCGTSWSLRTHTRSWSACRISVARSTAKDVEPESLIDSQRTRAWLGWANAREHDVATSSAASRAARPRR